MSHFDKELSGFDKEGELRREIAFEILRACCLNNSKPFLAARQATLSRLTPTLNQSSAIVPHWKT
jgi:hypothetical protein